MGYLDEHPDFDGYGIWPSDIYGSYCVCDNCRKWGPTTSDLMANYFRAVGEKVAQLRPGKYISALAYHKYNDAPKSEVKFPDNVVLSYVGADMPELFGYFREVMRQKSIKEWDGWARITKNMVWRPNNFTVYAAAPRVYVSRLGEDFRHFYRNKMIGVNFDRIMPDWAMDGINYYVTAKLTWDPEQSVGDIVDDYCTKGFGGAGPALKEYFTALEGITGRIAAERVNSLDHSDIPVYYTIKDLRNLRDIIKQAQALAAGDEQVMARIAFLSQGLDFAEIEVPLLRAIRDALKKKPSPEEEDFIRVLLENRMAFLRKHYASLALDAPQLLEMQNGIEGKFRNVTTRLGAFNNLPEDLTEVMQLPETWKFKIDPKVVGEKEDWYALTYDDSAWGTVRVGEFWEEQGYPDYDGTAWYRLKVKFPGELAGKTVKLGFGAADESAKVYVNGNLSGEFDIGPQGWDKRFFIDITAQVKPGQTNLLAVRVIDTDRAGGLWKPVKLFLTK